MEKSREYSEEQLFLIWFLYHFKQQEIWKGPYYVSKVFESIGRDLVLKKWIDELLDDGLIIGGSESSMLAQISKKGEDFLLSKPYLFKDIAKEYSWLLDNLKNDKFLSQISAFKSGKDQEDIKLEMSDELSDQIPEVVKESLRKIGREDIENSREPDYWLVGSYWHTENQRERLPVFDENNEWINGFGEDKYADLVNSVQKGDILICKSNYYSTRFKSATLRLKGYGKVASNARNGERLEVEWLATNWKYDIPKYGYYWNTISRVYDRDIDFIKSKLQEAIDGVFKTPTKPRKTGRKHALAKSDADQSLIDKGYKSQGLIGYINDSYFTGARKLFQRYSSEPNFFYFFESIVRGGEGDSYDTTTFGFIDPVEFQEGTRFRRFRSSSDAQDYIFCTNPDLETLEQEGYIEETNQGFESAFLSKVKKSGYSEVYVYSTDEDVRLFTPLDDEEVRENSTKNYKKATSFWSDSATDFDEFGRESLVAGVVESTNKLFENEGFKDSYSIHLNGEWGSGKSSMLKLFKKELEDTDWKIVEYNAWENQAFRDPWWILINAISKRAGQGDFKGEFNSHRYWKFKLQYRHKFVGLALLAIFVISAVFFFNTSSNDPTQNIGFYGSIIGLVGTIISVITGLTNNFFYKDVSKEDLKEQFSDHPFKPIRDRFDSIAKDNKLAIFIDDLDRCDVDPTVTLLEGIQNLFKGKKVLYVIAADGEWVSQCFTKKYQVFNQLGGSGGTIGDKFLQKSFQLRVDVPEIDQKALAAFWDRIINDRSKKVEASNAKVSEETKPKVESSGIQPTISQQEINRKFNQEKKEQIEEFNKDFEEDQEAYLKKFLKEGVSNNPRQMKRFVNQYKVAIYQKIVENDTDEMSDAEIKDLILQMNYPGIHIQLKKGVLVKEDFSEADPNKQNETIKSLSKEQLEEIRKLLEINGD